MEWFLYDKDLRYERVKSKNYGDSVISWLIIFVKITKFQIITTQQRFTCSKSTKGALEKGVKYLNLTIKTLERRQLRRSGVFFVNCEQVSYLFLVFLLLILRRYLFTIYYL